MKQNITVNMPNGDKLVAEYQDYAPYAISISIVNKHNQYLQDLVFVETEGAANNEPENKYNVYVYGNEMIEDWTDKFTIKRIDEDFL